MALCNETPCNCNPETDPCGCKTSSDEVVYTGPTLPCTGIENCTPVTEVISTISEYLCSSELIQVLLNTIINNETLLAQFTTIINNNIECQTIWDCATTTTTTTEAPPACYIYDLQGDNAGTRVWTARECGTKNIIGGAISIGATITTPCIIASTLTMYNVGIKDQTNCS